MNHTPNYNLSQWESEDKVLRTDFNENNAKIDAAIRAVEDKKAEVSALRALEARVEQVAHTVPQMVFGSYSGDGKPSQYIELGFQPRALLVFRADGAVSFLFSRLHLNGGLAYPGQPIATSSNTGLELTESGFRVYYNDDEYVYCNAKDTFRYSAFV